MSLKLKERPSFDQFKEFFKAAVAQHTGKAPGDYDRWLELGDEEKRWSLLRTLKERVEEEYGVELLLQEKLVSDNTLFESITIKLYHVYSTVYLMERINSKIRARQN
ncbi:MAG: hypothetical protein ACYDEQ_11100 [Desulfocucumaceae bacterium]